MKTALLFSLPVLFLASLSGCAMPPETKSSPSPLTHGNVQMTLKNGITTQNEVLEAFGPPNIMTLDGSGNEVWTYQKQATVTKAESANSYGTIILFGGGGGTSGFEQSSRTMTLIIKFDKDKKVMDFKSMATNF